VAVKRRSNSAAAGGAGSAAVIAQMTAPGDAGGGGEAEGATLCYGRVAVDAAPAAGQAAYRLSVEVEPGVYQTLLSTQVSNISFRVVENTSKLRTSRPLISYGYGMC
jgi:hypothetical protein